MARSKQSEGTEVTMDMTPMIDVVFLMIIFFMIVSDMSQQDLAELTLPKADMAQDDETEEGRMIINIVESGDLEIKRQGYNSLDDQEAQQAVRTYLQNAVALGEKDPDFPELSARSLLVRADKQTKFKEVQKLMRIAAEQGIGIYKIDLAAAQNEQ